MNTLLVLVVISLGVFIHADDVPGFMGTCSKTSECIPLPSECHPLSCVNRLFEQNFTKPTRCTSEFNCAAAYQEKDCKCEKGTCLDRNLKNNGGCDDEDEEFGFMQVAMIGLGLFIVIAGGVGIWYFVKRRSRRNTFEPELLATSNYELESPKTPLVK